MEKPRSDTVDLNDNSTLLVDISDALSEREKVKFTVHTKTSLGTFEKPEVSVQRQHEEFIWLHSSLEENEEYGGYIIPPAPPRPNFESSRDKLQKLGDAEGTMTTDEFNKMKAELEAEYLATFKKTVAMHEFFLQRLAGHPVFRDDTNFHVFLSYAEELAVRGKNKKEKMMGLFSSIGKSADELLLSSTQKDIDDSFETEKMFLVSYSSQVKEATSKADKMTRAHKNLADSYIKVSALLSGMSTLEMNNELETFFPKVAEEFEKARKLESRLSSDEDLKLSDVLRYYMRDTGAAKALLYRRLRCLANYEAANRTLEKARSKGKDVAAAEVYQKAACEKYEAISKQAKQELDDFRLRRVHNYRKSLSELADVELKQARNQITLLRNCISVLKQDVVQDSCDD